MSIADLDHRDYLTERKVQELRKTFALYDTDRGGSVDEDTVLRMFSSLGQDVLRRPLREAMETVNVAGPSATSFEEFCILYVKLNRYWPRPDLIDYRNYLSEAEIETLDQAFRQRDPKGHGWIDLTALQDLLESMKLPRKASSQKPLQVDRVVRQGLPSGSRLGIEACCAIYAVLARKRRRLNYREFLKGEEVDRFRAIFEQRSRGAGLVPLKDLDELLAALGLSLSKAQVRGLVQDFDAQYGKISFEEFCVLMCRLGKRRRQRHVSPATCDPLKLWRDEHFSMLELLLSGFSLQGLKEAGIQTGSMYKEGVPMVQFRRAGLSAAELRRVGASAAELRSGGFSLADLRLAGFSDALVCQANRKMRSCMSESALPALPREDQRLLSSITEASRSSRPPHAGTASASSAATPLPPVPKRQLTRQMTAVIREHMDCRPWRSQGAFHLPSLISPKASKE